MEACRNALNIGCAYALKGERGKAYEYLQKAVDAGYAWAGESTVNGVDKGDKKRIFLSAATLGMPIARNQGLKFAYIRNRTNASTGNDIDSFAVAWSLRF